MMRLNDVLDEGQTQSAASSIRNHLVFCLIKSLKNLELIGRRDSNAFVCHL